MRILLPMDESQFSQDALRAVINQYQRRGTEVRVLNVIQPVSAYLSADLMPHFVEHLDTIEKDRKRQAQKIVLRAADKLRDAGFKSSAVVTTGEPAAEIIERAKRWRADVIVIASYDLRGLNRLLMGSVSEAVARHADCSVEVVRMPRSRGSSGKRTAELKTPRR